MLSVHRLSVLWNSSYICHMINVQYNDIMVTQYKDMQYMQTNNSICIHHIQICSGHYICVHVCGQNPAVCGLTA